MNTNVRFLPAKNERQNHLNMLSEMLLNPISFENRNINPICNFVEIKGHFLAIFELPDFQSEDIFMEVKDNVLVLQAKKNMNCHFFRKFSLPSNMDANLIEASFDNNKLMVYFPEIKLSKKKISFS